MSRDIDFGEEEKPADTEETRFPLLATALQNPAGLPPVALKRAIQLERDGRLDLAAAAYAKLGHHVKAARLAIRIGATRMGATLLDMGGHRHEAAVMFGQLGDAARGFNCLVRQQVHMPGYVEACLTAVEISIQRRFYSPDLEALVEVFVSRAPRTQRETDAMLGLARLMADHGRGPQAVMVLERVLEVHPSHTGALAQRVALAHVSPIATHTQPGTGKTLKLDVTGTGTGPSHGGAGGSVAGLKEGAVVAGRYKLAQRLGRGGMGVVYQAEDMELQEEIALKILTSSDDDPASLVRFKREGATARQLAHPNIVRVYDFGSAEGFRYITMELLVGQTLNQAMRDGLSLLQACRLLRQACMGLQAAHDQGVVHRDVKPDNLFINSAGVLKVMDFGIAKAARANMALTGDGSLLGTPRYMSPEQFTGQNISPRSDIYSLGVVAYLLFTGSAPFDAPDLLPLMMMHTQKPVPAPRGRNPELPEELERVVLHMLQKKPEDRPKDCNEVRVALEQACLQLGEDITRG